MEPTIKIDRLWKHDETGAEYLGVLINGDLYDLDIDTIDGTKQLYALNTDGSALSYDDKRIQEMEGSDEIYAEIKRQLDKKQENERLFMNPETGSVAPWLEWIKDQIEIGFPITDLKNLIEVEAVDGENNLWREVE